MVSVVDQVTRDWKPGEVRDILREMERITIGVATKTLFGHDQTIEADKISASFEHILRLNISSGMLPVNLPFLPYGRLLRESAALEAMIRGVIVRKRASGESGIDVLSLFMDSRDEEQDAHIE